MAGAGSLESADLMRREVLLISLVGVLLLEGCTYVNEPLNSLDKPAEGRRKNSTPAALVYGGDAGVAGAARDDGWFVGLAISGGGSRSANFSAAVMFELARLGLLRRVDAISPVSGGSLSAAYYCLSGDADWNPGNVQRKLTHKFATDMWWTVVAPWNMFALTFTDWDRSDVMARIFRKELFSRGGRTLTYADLRADRPRLLINATDLQSGKRFVFCNESFDQINSDLSKYPVAYAVSASSSVPVVLHQVTLRDFSMTFKQFRHFVDGGVEDNLGVLTLLETYQKSNEAATKAGRPVPYGKGAVLVIIDAGTQFNAKLSDRGDVGLIEGLGTSAALSSAKLINRASSATLADLIVQYAPPDITADEIRKHLEALSTRGYIDTKDKDGRPLTIIHIALSRAAGLKDLPYATFAQSLEDIDTYFNIPEPDAYLLYRAAELIVRGRFEEKLGQIRQALDGR
jgi:predicted acylesterase/phospholipase RssA